MNLRSPVTFDCDIEPSRLDSRVSPWSHLLTKGDLGGFALWFAELAVRRRRVGDEVLPESVDGEGAGYLPAVHGGVERRLVVLVGEPRLEGEPVKELQATAAMPIPAVGWAYMKELMTSEMPPNLRKPWLVTQSGTVWSWE